MTQTKARRPRYRFRVAWATEQEADPETRRWDRRLDRVLISLLIVSLPFNGLASQMLDEDSLLRLVTGALKDVLLAALIVRALVRGRPDPKFVVAVLLCWMSTLVAGLDSPSLGTAAFGFRNDYWGLALIVFVPALCGAESRLFLGRLILVMAELSAAVAIITHRMGLSWLDRVIAVSGDGSYNFSFFTAGSNVPRAFSPYVSPNELAAAMAVTLCLLTWPALAGFRWRLLLSIAPIVALLLARSRSGVLDVLAGLSVVAFLRYVLPWLRKLDPGRRGMAIFAGLALLPVAAYFASLVVGHYSQEPSAVGHVESLQNSLISFATHPFGFGLGEVGPRAAAISDSAQLTESSILLIGLEVGWIGLAYYCVLLAMVAAVLWRGATAPGAHADPARAAVGLAVLAATLPSQLVLPTIQDIPVAWLWWILLGLALPVRTKPVRTKPVVPRAAPQGLRSQVTKSHREVT